MAPAIVPAPGRPDTNPTLTFSVAGPVPDAGDTLSHGTFDDAVHVTVPDPACDRRTAWAVVCATSAAPFVEAPKYSHGLSIDIAGPVPVSVTTKGCPAMVIVPTR